MRGASGSKRSSSSSSSSSSSDEEDAATVNQLDGDLQKVRSQNHVLEAFKIKSDQLKEIHDHLIEERKIVAKFDKLKFV